MTLAVKFLLLAVLAIYARAGAVALRRPISDFYVAGRLVPGLFNGMAIAVSLIPVLAFAEFAGVLSQGWDGASLLVLGGGGGILVVAFLLAPYLRKFGGYTIPDFLGERFGGTGVRPLAVLAVILCSFPALALALLGLGVIAAQIFGVDPGTGIGLGVAMLMLCSFAAGMRSASLTQIVQYAVLLAVSVVALALLVWQQGAVFSGAEPGGLKTALAIFKLDSFAAEDSLNRFALLFCLGAGIASLPHILMRGLVTPTIEEARTSFLWALPFTGVLSLVTAPYLALFDSPPAASSQASAILFFGLIAIGAIAALLAVGSGLVLAIANALSYDLYYRSLHLSASTERRILIARAAILLVAALAAWAAFAAPDALPAMTGASFSLAASALLPALLLGVWWKRATGEGALAGMLVGLAVCLYYMLAPRYIPFAFYETSSLLSNAAPDEAARYVALRQGYYLADETARAAALAAWQASARGVANWGGVKSEFAALFAVPVGFLVMIGVSLFTPAPSREVQSFVEDLRKPQAA
ncbi:MAG: sodium:solute symporter family transporter [Methyloceanibacter sp.]